MGASLAFGVSRANAAWNQRREFYPEGVASGDSHPDSVLLWTRRPPVHGNTSPLKWWPIPSFERPSPPAARPVRFTFVSCPNVTQGAQNTYRRIISEDEAREANERLQFMLHLGNFVYEIVWYPEDRPQGMYDRRIRDVARYPHGEKIGNYHLPTTMDDYRALCGG
jgi:alkaline phosphatase D